MRKTILILAIIAAYARCAGAQASSGYQVDNFDFANAVQIQTPKVELPQRSSIKRLTMSRNYTHVPPPGALVDLTSQPMNPSLGGFTTGNSDFDKFIVESGQRNSVDPMLLYAIMHQESTFKPRAMSHKGARGLMQLIPPTASRFGVTNIWDPSRTSKAALDICGSCSTCSQETCDSPSQATTQAKAL